MPLFSLYQRQIEEVHKRINEAMRVFSTSRPDLFSKKMENPPALISPLLTQEIENTPILAVDGGSRATHFKWISACFAHAIAVYGKLNNPGKWTIPEIKNQITALTIYKRNISRINDYIRSSVEFETAVAVSKKHQKLTPLLLLDGSIANTYRFIARYPKKENFFVNRKRLINGRWMKTNLIKLLENGIKVVAISKDSRIKHLPTVERTVSEDYQGKIVVADPIDFANEDIVDRDVVTSPPYIWLLLVRFTDKGRVYRVEIPLLDESQKDLQKQHEILSMIRASVEINEPRMMPIRRLGYPYPLACVDAIARLNVNDSEWIHQEILRIVKKYYPYQIDFFKPEVGEAVHTR